MKSVSTREAKTHLSQLLAVVEAGEDVIICRGSVPTARLSRVDPAAPSLRRRPLVGAITSEGVRFDETTFAPLGVDELSD